MSRAGCLEASVISKVLSNQNDSMVPRRRSPLRAAHHGLDKGLLKGKLPPLFSSLFMDSQP